jgi:hypothetical protein
MASSNLLTCTTGSSLFERLCLASPAVVELLASDFEARVRGLGPDILNVPLFLFNFECTLISFGIVVLIISSG